MAHTAQPAGEAPALGTLPAQPISREVLLEKYARDGETDVGQVRARIARSLARAELEAKQAHWEARFLEAMERGFIPAG